MAAGSTYTPIATTTLGSAATSYTFSSIPSTYTDLVLVGNTIVASGTGYEFSVQFNGDTASNYSNTYLLGSGSSAISGRGANASIVDAGYLNANSGNPNTRILNIMNYSNTTTYKTVISRASGENGQQAAAYVNLWRSTSAINSIKIYSASGLTYAIGSTFTLYGIAAA
jgi:hypothetical protein